VNIPLAVFAFFGGILAIGIGFGAQHLIGNFISSIILMFDRTISVGDIVEMEGQFGRVKSIGLRSSSIRRFDGVEVLVPNSQFLEQKVTNWTLSDQKVRYEIAVGAAYGSPTQETSARILGVIREDDRVLASPEPVVIFENFGEDALMFRAFLWLALDAERDNRVVCSDIRHRIAEALDRAGIVIAFPQRDVHLDTKGPIEVKLLPGDRGGPPET
jgi:small-conductance mechanosensitive channel